MKKRLLCMLLCVVLVAGLAMPAFAEGLTLTAAALHNDAGLVGAVRYLLQHG